LTDNAGRTVITRSARRRPTGRSVPARRLVAGGAIGAVAALLFLLAFHAVAVVESGAAWERAWLLAIHASWGPAATGAATDLSLMGYPNVIIPLTAVLLALWLLRRSGWKAARFLTVTLALAIVDYGAKPFFGRPRPALFPHAFVAGASYPSGHALFAVGYYGVIASLLAWDAPRGLRTEVLTLWAVVAAGLGLSRLVLGVHWPTDVVAGYVAGAIVWIAVAVAARRRPAPAPVGTIPGGFPPTPPPGDR
jgi:undecaprenyl-diphosphatase